MDFSGDPPSFCAYCGHSLRDPQLVTTLESDTAAYPRRPVEDDGAPPAIGGYRLIRQLGRGGMGTVYEAEGHGRRVAVKLPSNAEDRSGIALERFRQEGRLASMIAHPRCVFVVAADEEAGRPYIVMELMPGSTLKDLVDERGPLAPEEAVRLILDVIEGLKEAHQLGVIHRDVKPSNCFRLPDGRVKIGDFGLSRSLHSEAHLTQTGAFLGTPLFAAPEQIKGARIDIRSDVYSTAATLYFLLSGKAPFQDGGGSAAILARIVSEPAPPIRKMRPDVSPALEQVLLRGLERDRDRRWRDLAEFEAALRALIPGQLSFGGMGMRVGAFVIDVVLFGALTSFLLARAAEQGSLLLAVGSIVPLYLYFLVLDGLWGGSLGKRWLRLRVWSTHAGGPPGLLRALPRTLVVAVLISVPLAILLHLNAYGWLLVSLPAGAALLALPMRAHNGYRGLQDMVGDTRVVELPRPEQESELARRAARQVVTNTARPEDVPEQIGAYRIVGALYWRAGAGVLHAEDPVLGRKLFLRVCPSGSPGLEGSRRDLTRPTRLRWLASGNLEGRAWDAFVAPTGCPLTNLVSPSRPLPWEEARPVLAVLADELAAACADGTLPAAPGPEQVWVGTSGRIQLLDFPATAPEVSADRGETSAPKEQALGLLREVAVLALEGQARRLEEESVPIRAALPLHAVPLTDRLLGAQRPSSLEGFLGDLEATRDHAAAVTPAMRAAYLGTMVLLFTPGLMMMILTSIFAKDAIHRIPPQYIHFAKVHELLEEGAGKAEELGKDQPLVGPLVGLIVASAMTLWPAAWVIWAFLMRGGLVLSSMGMALVRADGRRASRFACAWRMIVLWAPVATLLTVASVLMNYYPDQAWMHWSVRGLAVALIPGYVVLTLLLPGRALHDRLAGTYVVPR